MIAAGDRDVTREATYASTDPAVATVDAAGYVSAAGNGATTIRVTHAAGQLVIPVRVSGVGATGRAVDFRTEVVPLLSKLGCNAGGCHGKASGQNGFKLSLFGFDTDFDHAAITREARGRRLFPAAPDRSLFLRKASGQVPHGGGKRLRPDSADYQVVRQWIAAGALASAPTTPVVKRLRVVPTDRVLRRDQQQQLAVLVEYTDGSVRDVTRQSEFASNLDVVASVDPTGLVKSHQLSGEAAVMARHMGHVAVFRALVRTANRWPIPEFRRSTVDELPWRSGRSSACGRPVCDATFLRRATIDLCGRPPTPPGSASIPADTTADKRTRLIDRLLDSPDYPAYFALRWGASWELEPGRGRPGGVRVPRLIRG